MAVGCDLHLRRRRYLRVDLRVAASSVVPSPFLYLSSVLVGVKVNEKVSVCDRVHADVVQAVLRRQNPGRR